LDGHHRRRNTLEGCRARRRTLRSQPEEPALTLAAAASIAEAGLDQADEAVAIVVFVALGSTTVAGAVLMYLLDAERAARPLDATKRFMSDNTRSS
jgi:hypothetical protein